MQIFYGLKDIGGNPFPYALVAVMLVSSVLFYAIGKGLFGRDSYAMMAKATVLRRPARAAARRARWLCTALFRGRHLRRHAAAPRRDPRRVLQRLVRARCCPQHFTLDNFRIALGHDLTVPAIANSLKYASISTRHRPRARRRHRLRHRALETRRPAGPRLPRHAAARRAGPRARLRLPRDEAGRESSSPSSIRSHDPTLLLIIAYSIRRLPYVVRSAAAGFQQTSETLEEAAQNLGCPPLKAVFKITLPLIMANLIAGGLLAFAFAMLEVSDSLILAQKQAYYPITKAIYELFQLLGDGKFIASALGVWAMAFLGITIVGLSLLLGKKLGAIFRV